MTFKPCATFPRPFHSYRVLLCACLLLLAHDGFVVCEPSTPWLASTRQSILVPQYDPFSADRLLTHHEHP